MIRTSFDDNSDHGKSQEQEQVTVETSGHKQDNTSLTDQSMAVVRGPACDFQLSQPKHS